MQPLRPTQQLMQQDSTTWQDVVLTYPVPPCEPCGTCGNTGDAAWVLDPAATAAKRSKLIVVTLHGEAAQVSVSVVSRIMW
jgi:hypothetical protein